MKKNSYKLIIIDKYLLLSKNKRMNKNIKLLLVIT